MPVGELNQLMIFQIMAADCFINNYLRNSSNPQENELKNYLKQQMDAKLGLE